MGDLVHLDTNSADMTANGGHCDYYTLTVGICGEVDHSTHGLPQQHQALLGDLLDLAGDAVDSAGYLSPALGSLTRCCIVVQVGVMLARWCGVAG